MPKAAPSLPPASREQTKWNTRILIISRLLVDLMRETHSSLHDNADFGSNSECALVLAAIVIGQLEHKAMSATKIAQYVGIPRGTVLRRLEELQGSGFVSKRDDKKFIFPMLGVKMPRWVTSLETMERSVHGASAALSKLDR